MRRTIFGVSVVVALTMVILPGCGGDKTSPTQPGVVVDTLVNNPDNFQYQSSGNQNVSLLLDYTWTNTGTQATITHSSTIDSGTALLYLYDGNGQLVYSNGLSASAVEQSQIGTAGDWLVRISVNNFWGTLSFRVQKL